MKDTHLLVKRLQIHHIFILNVLQGPPSMRVMESVYMYQSHRLFFDTS